MILIYMYIPFAIAILYTMNKLTTTLCEQRSIPEEKQPQLFRTINLLITILLLSSYVEILYT